MTSVTRIYQAIPLAKGTWVRLNEQASHHVGRVLRAKVGDNIILFNGEGGEYAGVISHIDRKSVDVELIDFVPKEAESPVNIYLAQGTARGEKMDFIVQKSVELGIKKIIPLVTERCNVRLDAAREAKRLAHWQSVVISACEQCGRNRLPDIMAPVSFDAWLPEAEADQCFVLSPHVSSRLSIATLSTPASIILLIGPEGGLSDREVERAEQQGFTSLNLGPRILRTETAGVAAITVLQCLYGDMINK